MRTPCPSLPARLPALSRAAALAAALLGGMAGLPATAQEPTVLYTVEPQDTLIGLSRQLLVNPAAWPEVARLNRLPDPNRITPGQGLQVPTRLLRSAEQPALLLSGEGDVLIDGQPAQAGAQLKPGQRLSTAAASSAVLQLGDGSRVKLLPQSDTALSEHRRFELKAAAASPGTEAPEGVFATSMRLVRGTLELLASKLPRAKPLEVSTPTAVIGVRGTDYRVRHDDQAGAVATRTEVLSGRVRADAQGAAEVGRDLSAGEGAALREGERRPRVAPLPAAPSLQAMPRLFERPLVRFKLADEPGPLRVQVAADAAFNRVLRDESVPAGGEVRLAGLPDGTWHLRARRVGAEGLEGPDTQVAWVLKARPEPPLPASPPLKGKVMAGEVSLSWARNPDAATERLEVARDAAFEQIVARQDGLSSGSTRVRIDQPGTYHWRLGSVRADGDRGPWSDARSFEARPPLPAAQGSLSEDGRLMQFAWSGEPSDRHQAELARDAGFAEVVARADLTEPRWSLPTPTQPGTYYIRYRAIEADGFITDWSSPQQLEVPRNWQFLWFFAPLLLAL